MAAVEVYLETRQGRVTLGTLTKEGQEFVFRYDPRFAKAADSTPISAFPDLDREYRAEELWPFFAVRIPPVDREDVRQAMEKRHIPEKDVLRLLAELSGRGVSSPYRFAMAGRAG
ncbi:MAG: HipA N-terminal domain-containing protein [Anaeromyxobacteraceae bacterium]|nr:HipA N-terminal domain-containing protein [Anaeromyxobacteraceae bacterium]